MNKTRTLLIGLIAAAAAAYFLFDLGQYLSLDYIQSRLARIQAFADSHFALAAAAYFLVYVAAAALSVPGAAILTLLGGAVFGLLWGVVIVSFASSIGATLAFLASRTLLRDWVQSRFGDYLGPVNRGIEKDGAFYLFSIRLVPLFPFFMVNLLMGLTPIRTASFYLVSQFGMVFATVVYVNAGSELAGIASLSGLASAPVILSFTLLGLFPLAARLALNGIRRRRIMRPYPRPRRFDANVVVIGAGSAGLVAALIAAGAKARTVLIEKGKMGGDCLNTGCVPSKTLIRSGRVMALLRRAGEYGIDGAGGAVDFARVMARVREVIAAIEPHDSAERYTSLGVECVAGEARIESPWTVAVGGRVLRARSIIVATGARPAVPPVPGLEETGYLTSDTVWSLRELPRRLLVAGGGPIGCELAQAFRNLGSQVTLVDMADRILPREDDDVARVVAERFERDGIRMLAGRRMVRFGRADGGGFMEAERDGRRERVEFDQVLIATGRRPNVEGFGLEALDMPLTPDGAIEVDAAMRTAYPTIYACGDVAGPYQFTHMASFQAFHAAVNALLGNRWRVRARYRAVPWATFTDPEVARVGLSEREAAERGVPFEVTRHPLDRLDRALAEGEACGFVKVLTAPGRDRILGAAIVGPQAGELIGEFVSAMTWGLGLKKIAATTHIYPTLLEANRFAANAWRSARLPERYFPLMARFFSWQRGRGPADA